MTDGEEPDYKVCTVCGAFLETGAESCIICGTPAGEAPEGMEPAEDEPEPEPQVQEEESQEEISQEPTGEEKDCPSCGSIIGADVTTCFLCDYDFETGEPAPAEGEKPADWDMGIVGGEDGDAPDVTPEEEPAVEEDTKGITDAEGITDIKDVTDTEGITDIEEPEDEPESEPELGPDEFMCPSCEKPLEKGTDKCPHCWAEIPEMIHCPSCAFFIPLESTVCENCYAKLDKGVLIEEPPAAVEEEPLEITEPVPEVEPAEEYYEEEVYEEEFVEEYGIECPFCATVIHPDSDICSECGMPLVEMEEDEEKKGRDWTVRKPIDEDYQRKIAIILVIVLVTSALLPFLFALPHVERGRISIDGQFGDWVYIGSNIDRPNDQSNPNLDIVDYKLVTDAANAFFYLEVAGVMFGDSSGDTARIFIDTDQDENTGYRIQGIGADFQIRVFGHGGDMESVACFMFNNARNHSDINGFETDRPVDPNLDTRDPLQRINPVPYANDTAVEVRVNLTEIGSGMGNPITAVYFLTDSYGEHDFSDFPATNIGSVLHVFQSSAVAPSGLLTGNAPILNLNFTANGDEFVLVDDFDIPAGYTLRDSSNNVVSYPLNISANSSEIFTLYFNTASASSGSFFSYEIMSSAISASGTDVVVQGAGAFAYVDSAPTMVNIDGAFADWSGIGQIITDAQGDVRSRNQLTIYDPPRLERLDATEFRELQENDNLNLYLDVEGDMFAGFDVPIVEDMYHDTIPVSTRSETKKVRELQPPENATIGTRQVSPTIRPPAVYRPQSGEDAVLVFIDINNDTSDGFLLNGIGADRLLDIRGQYGKVTSVTAYEFNTSRNDQNFEDWNEITAPTAIAASDGTKMEASISLSDLGIALGDEFSVHFHVMDWNKNGDIGDELVFDVAMNTRGGVRGGPGPFPGYISGKVYDASGTTRTIATVIADYPNYNCFLICSPDQGIGSSPGGVGYYTFEIANGHTVSLYATNGTWINNTESVTAVGAQTLETDLNLNAQAPAYAPYNFTARNYGNGPDILLDWDTMAPPDGGYRIYRSKYYIWGNGLRVNKTQYIADVPNTDDWYIDSNVVVGETYYYFIASLDGGVTTAFSPLEQITAHTSPNEPTIVYGFVKDNMGNLIPGADVTVENYNFTNSHFTHSMTTDLNGKYMVTLQPWEHRTDNSTIWCNATLGGLEGHNTTTIPEWYPEGGYYGDRTDSAICNITICPPNVTVNKTVDFAIASPGQELIYTIWINNTDTWNATVVWVNDTLPNEVNYNSDNSSDAIVDGWASNVFPDSWGQIYNWTFYNVTPGNHAFDIYVTINSTTPNGTVLVNWVFCNYTAGNDTISLPGNYSWDNATTLVIVSNITVEKSVDLAVAYPGDYLTYTIYFNNTGGTDAVYLWINDTLPPEVTFISHTANDPVLSPTSQPYFQNFNQVVQNLFFEFANVPPFPLGLHQFDITVQVNSWVLNNTIATNWVFCNYTTEFFKAPESNASANTTIIRPDIIVNKTVDLAEALPDDLLTYTIWFNNTNAIASRVWINDTLPAGVIYVSDTANLVAGATFVSRNVAGNPLLYLFSNVQYGPHSFDITVRILDSTPFCTWLNNTVSCDYAPAGYTTFDNASTHVIRPVIDIVKIVNQTYAYPGETVNYTIYFNNTDTASATNVWINDTLPADVTYVDDSAATNATHTLTSKGNSGRYLWFNFTDVGPGDHYFNVMVRLNDYLNESEVLWNWAVIEYTQENGLKYGPYLDSAFIIVIGGPIIDVEKVASQPEVNTGDVISYQIFFNNTGNGNASYVWINDTLPVGVSYISDNANTLPEYASSGQSGQYLWFNFTDVAPGPHSFIINVTVTNDTDGTVLTNWVFCNYISTTGIQGLETMDFADVTLTRPVITVGKTVDKDVASPGDLLTYNISFNNEGSYPADVWINDTLPLNVTYLAYTSDITPTIFDNSALPLLTWYFTNVQVGNHWIEIIVQINTTTPSGTYLNNTVELNYTCPSSGYEFTGSEANATTIVSAMTVEKTVDMANANPGDYLNYTIFFNNTASFTIDNVWINDTLPAGVEYVTDNAASLAPFYDSSWVNGQDLYFNFTNLPQGFYSFIITVWINASLPPGTWLNNTAFMNYTDDAGNTLPESNDSAETRINRPIIVVDKTVDLAVANPGDTLTYTIWFNNTGSVNASHVWVNDTLPAELDNIVWSINPPAIGGVLTILPAMYSWYFADLPPDSVNYITITGKINEMTPDDTNLTNNVTCEYEMENGIGWNSSANATTWVIAPIIDVQKTVDKPIAYPGESLTYTIWFNNTGFGPAAYVWINDTLPLGVVYSGDTAATVPGVHTLVNSGNSGLYLWFNFTNVMPGIHSFTITVTINTDVSDGQILTNYVSAEYETDNGLGRFSDAWANTTIIRPNITAEKTVDMAEANPGDYLTYTIYFNNTGNGTANVTIEDMLPNWVIFQSHTAATIPGVHVFTLPNGASGRYLWFNFTDVLPGEHNFTITVLVGSSAPDCPMLVNNVTCEYGWWAGMGMWTPPATTDNATTHINRPTITVTKDVDYSVASPGFYLNYTITFDNTGSGLAAFVWINDTLPNGVIFVTDTANLIPWFMAPTGQSGQRLYFNFTNVPGFSSNSFQITVWINPALVSPGDVLINWVHLNYTAENLYELEESIDNAITIISAMAVVKTVDIANTVPGTYLNYTILFNNTNGLAAWVWINDTLPAGVVYVNDTAWLLGSFISFSQVGQVLYFTFQNVPALSINSFQITVWINTTVAPGTTLENWVFMNYTNDVGAKMIGSSDFAITYVGLPVIDVNKTVDKDVAYPGEYLTYTIYFNNTGSDNASVVWIHDTLPGWVQYIGDTSGLLPPDHFSSGQFHSWRFTDVTPGSHSFTVTVRIMNNTPDNITLTNYVWCNFTFGGIDYVDGSASADTRVIRPVIAVEKSVDLAEAYPGDTLTYTIWYNNTGNGNAMWVNITDILPDGVIFVSSNPSDSFNVSNTYYWNFTNIAPWTTNSIVITVVINTSVEECNTLVNWAFLNYTIFTGVIFNGGMDSASTHIIAPNITVEKSAAPAIVAPGGDVYYTIWFNNTGLGTADYVWVNDTLPAGVTYVSDTAAAVVGATFMPPTGVSGQYLWFNFTSVLPGTHSFQIQVQVNTTGVSDGDVLTNWAYCNYSIANGLKFNETKDWANVTISSAVIDIVKVVNMDVAYPNDVLNYTIWFNNTGNGTAAWVTITDVLPLYVTYLNTNATTLPEFFNFGQSGQYLWFNFTNVAPGNYSFWVTVLINSSTPDGTWLNNTVVCNYTTETGYNPPETNDTAETLVIAPNITVVKSVDMAFASPGDYLNYTIWYNNTGSGNAAWVNITDTLPPGVTYIGTVSGPVPDVSGSYLWWNLTNVPPLSVNSIVITVQINPATPSGTILVNNATLNYTIQNGLELPGSEDNATTVVSNATVVKTVSDAVAVPGQYITYIIYYNNTNGIINFLSINETLPSWAIYVWDNASIVNETSGQSRWYNFTNVAPGSHSFMIIVQVDPNTPDDTPLVNYVWMNYTIGGVHDTPSFDTALTLVIRPNITVEKSVNLAETYPGDFLVYTIWYSNTGSGTADWVNITDILPPGVIYLGGTPPSGNSGNTYYWNYTNVAPGAYAIFIIVGINGSVVPCNTLINWVFLNYTIFTGVTFDMSFDNASTHIIGPDITVEKSVDQSGALPGEFLVYTIWFNNTGTDDASDVWINDTLPNGVTYWFDDSGVVPTPIGGNAWSWHFTNVGVGNHVFNITALIWTTAPICNDLINWVYCNYSVPSGVMFPETRDNATTHVDGPIITVEKSVDNATATLNETLMYTIWFNNTGNTDASFVWINDTLPSWAIYVNDSAWTLPEFAGSWNDSVTWCFNFTNVAPGSYSFNIWVIVDPNTQDNTTLRNWAFCDYYIETGIDYYGGSDYADTLVIRPNITVEKSVDTSETYPGDTLTYTIWYNNTGSGNAAWVNITDTLPPGVAYTGTVSGPVPDVSGSYLWWNLTDVLPLTINSIVITVVIDASVEECNTLVNGVFLNYTVITGYELDGGFDNASTHIIAPNMTIEKSVDRNIASPGDYLTYTITFTNSGLGTAAFVWINDTLPNGVVWISDNASDVGGTSERSGRYLYFNFTNVLPGTYSFDIRVYINPSVENGTLLVNWVYLNYSIDTGVQFPEVKDNATTLIAIMAVVKTVSVDTVKIGDIVTYTIFFNNTGNFTIPYLWINDTLPAGMSYISDTASAPSGSSSATLAGGWNDSVTWYYNFTNVLPGTHWFTIAAQVDATNPPGTLLSNMVQLNYTDDLGNGMIGSIDWANCTVAEPILDISKDVNLADASPGNQLVYTITLWNTGTDATGMVWVNDTLPVWLSYVSDTAATSPTSAPYWVNSGVSGQQLWFNFTGIGPGESCMFTITVSVNLDTPDWTNITNWAFANYTSPSGYPMEPIFDNATTTIHRPIIDLDKTVDLAVANPGDTLIYTIWYNNTGSGTARWLNITDTLPPELTFITSTPLPTDSSGDTYYWNLTDVAPGSYIITIEVTIDSATPNCNWLNNSAFWEYTFDNGIATPEPQDETENATTHVIAPVIDLEKIVDADVAAPGDTLTYTIFFNNTGVDTAAFVWINDTLPANWLEYGTVVHTAASVVGATLSSWGQSGRYLWFNFIAVLPGLHDFTISVDISLTTPDGTNLTNTATCDYTAMNGFQFDRMQEWANTTVIRPTVTVTKEVDLSVATVNDTLQYTITFNNTGSGVAAFVWINDTLPAEVTWVNDTAWLVPGFTGSWNDSVTWYYNFTNVAPGSYSFLINVTVDYTTQTDFLIYNNVTCAYTAVNGAVLEPETNDTAVTRIIRPWIVVTKQAVPGAVGTGEMIQYIITFDNTGADYATYVNITDILDPNVTYVNDTAWLVANAIFMGLEISGQTLYFNFTDVAPGAHSFVINVTVNAGLPEGLVLTNLVFLNYTANNSAQLEPSQDWGNTTVLGVNITVVKYVDSPWATPGDTLTYTIQFDNLGSTFAAYVNITDILPAGVTYLSDSASSLLYWASEYVNPPDPNLFFNFTNVPPGAHSFVINVTVDLTDPDGMVLENFASLNYTDPGGNDMPGSNDSANTTVRAPIVEIWKEVNQTIAYPGDALQYTIWFNNSGSGVASFVWVNDTLPENVTYVSHTAGLLPWFTSYSSVGLTHYFTFMYVPSGNYSFDIFVTINTTGLVNNTLLMNTVTSEYEDLNNNTGQTDIDWANTTVVDLPWIVVEKAVNQTFCQSPDFLQYTIWFNNTGTAVAGFVNITDILPAGVTYLSDSASSVPFWASEYVNPPDPNLFFNFTDVPQGNYWFVINVSVNSGLLQGTYLNNTAILNYTNATGVSDPVLMPISWANTTTIVTNVSMVIIKTTANATADPGDLIQYTLSFYVNGTETAAFVNITDVLPADVAYDNDTAWLVANAIFMGLEISGQTLYFNFTNVALGAHSFVINVSVNPGLPDGWILENWAFLNFTNQTGVQLLPSQDNAITNVTAPIMMVEKVPDIQFANPGDSVTFVIWFNNTGSGEAAYVNITDILPIGLTYVSDTAAVAVVQIGQTLYFNFTNVPGYSINSFTITVVVTPLLPDGLVLQNNVFLNYSDANNNSLPGSSDDALVIITAPEIVVQKSAPGTASPGDQITYTIFFDNTGSGVARWVNITDIIPPWTSFTGVHTANLVAGANFVGLVIIGQTLYFNFTFVQPGAHSFTITVQIDDFAPGGELTNWVFLNYTDANGNPLSMSMDSKFTIIQAPVIILLKEVDKSVANPGDFLTYTIYFNNLGSGIARYVNITDRWDILVNYISDTNASVTGVDRPPTSWSPAFNGRNYFFTNVTPGSHFFTITVRILNSTSHGSLVVNHVTCEYAVTATYPMLEEWANTTVVRPMITIEKAVDMTEAAPYDILTYFIWFNNTGSQAVNVWIKDTLSPFVTYISDSAHFTQGFQSKGQSGNLLWFNFTNVGPGVYFFIITVEVKDTVSNGMPLPNIITCNYTVENGLEWYDSDDVTTWVRMPVITISKDVDKSEAYPNEILIYTISVTNIGSKTAPIVRVEDTLPSEVTYLADTSGQIPWNSGNQYRWTFYNLPAGSTITFSMWVRVNWNAPEGIITNNVWCNFTLPSGVWMTGPSDFAQTTIIRPIISVEKIVDKSVANPGDYLYYTIYYNNTGNGTADTVWVNDTLPVGVTGLISLTPGALPYYQVGRDVRWRFTGVGPGDHSFTFRVRISESVTNGTWLTNWAFCNYTGPIQSGYLKFEETWDRADTLVSLPEINVVKVANVTTVNPGGFIVYTIYYNNTGSVALDVTITDILPEWVSYYNDSLVGITPSIFGNSYIWNIGTVSPGPHSFTITVNVSSSMDLPDGEILVNQAVCYYRIENGMDWETTDHANVTVVRPTIQLVKTVNLDVAYPYDILVYTIQFNNIGSDNAAFLWLNDTLPAWGIYINDTAWNVSGAVFVGKWNMGNVWYFNFTDVTPGLHNFTIRLRVSTSVPDGVVMANLATCDYKAESNLSFTQESDYAITLIRRPIISVEKSANQTNAYPGDSLLYTLYFNNTGSGTAANLWINDTLPIGVMWDNDTAWQVPGFTGSWYDGMTWHYNFTNILPGLHSFDMFVLIDLNISSSIIINQAICEYQAENGFNYQTSYANVTSTIRGIGLIPPEITTVPPDYVFAGDYFELSALIWDPDGSMIDQVMIYFTLVNGTKGSMAMSPSTIPNEIDANGRGWYYVTMEPQLWKGIVTYYVWAIDSDGLTNRTGYNDVRIILPPYYVWGHVIPASYRHSVSNSMVIIFNNATNESVVTMADVNGYYILDLGKLASGYLTGQGITVMAIDGNFLWYGYSYGTTDISHYSDNPELPPDISDSEGRPYQNIDIYLTEIPEFSQILVPLMIVLVTFVVFRRKKRRVNVEEDN